MTWQRLKQWKGWVVVDPFGEALIWTASRTKAGSIEEFEDRPGLSWSEHRKVGYRAVKASMVETAQKRYLVARTPVKSIDAVYVWQPGDDEVEIAPPLIGRLAGGPLEGL